MLLSTLVATSAEVAGTRSRLAKTQAVADALLAADPDEIDVVARYLAGHLPQRRTGVGWRSLATLPEPAARATLQVRDVDRQMTALQEQAGAGSAGRRAELVATLFAAATADEQQYLRALMMGEVRQGALDGVLLAAIARAADVPEAEVRRAAMLAGFAGPVAVAALADGIEGLRAIRLEPGRPIRPMLAASAPSVREALDVASGGADESSADSGAGARHVVIERKLDGIRLQIHKVGDVVRLFTRSLDEITDRLPEVVEFARSLPADVVVLDAEALVLHADGSPAPFQVTGSRTASSATSGQPVHTFVFDLLHVDGEDLLTLPLSERARRLAEIVPAEQRVPRLETADPVTAEAFFAEQVRTGHEGVLVKTGRAGYLAGRRGSAWVKVKPRHTLDLVVLAVEWGSGRRRGKLSNIHLGARDDRPGATGFVMLGKTFKGMTDELLEWQTSRFLELETGRENHVVHVRPEQVVEIAIDGLQRSSRYPGGVALRFARVLRYRDDKTADQADTLSSVLSLGHPGVVAAQPLKPDQRG